MEVCNCKGIFKSANETHLYYPYKYQNFAVAPLKLATPVIGLIDCLKVNTVDAETYHYLPRVDASSHFGILIMRCMHCLLKECRLRDPATFVVAIGISLASVEKNENIFNRRIQKEATEILKRIFIDTPNHFSRVLYQLCIPSNQVSSDLQLQQEPSPVDSEVSTLLNSRMDRNQRLQLVTTVIKIAQKEDLLKGKVHNYRMQLLANK